MIHSCSVRIVATLAMVAGFCLAAAPASAAPPERIVSINACADQLLLALADPGQIAALSIYAADPTISYLAAEAARFPHNAGSAESVIEHTPDLVLAGRFTKRETRAMLKRLCYRVVELDSAQSVDASIKQIREVAALLGHPDRGEALIQRIDAAAKRAEADGAGVAPTVAVYQRRGYVTGGGTLTGELVRLAGFRDDGGALAGKTGGFVPLERFVATRPDYIVVSDLLARPVDQGSALLAHPALAALYPPDRRIALPGRLTVCAGPSLPEAIETLAAARARIGQTAR